MKYFLCLFLFSVSFSVFSQTPHWEWVNGYGGVDGADIAADASLDSQGNIYVAINFQSQSICIGNDTHINSGLGDILLVKFLPSGQVVWTKRFGGTNEDVVTSICINQNNEVFISGYFISQALFFGNHQISANGGKDIFLAKLNTSGEVLWATSAGGNNDDISEELATDTNGNVFITGDFQSNTLSFGSTSISRSVGCSDIYLAKYDPSGELQWVNKSSFDYSTSYAEGDVLAIDSQNNIIIGGFFADGDYGHTGGTYIRIGTDTISNRHVVNAMPNAHYSPTALLVKFDNAGNFISGYSDSTYLATKALACDMNNNIYASGYSQFGISIGLTPMAFTIFKTDPDFNLLWRNEHLDAGVGECTHLASHSDGSIYATGYYANNQMVFQTGTLGVNNYLGHRYHEMLLWKIDTLGNEEWVLDFGGILSDKSQVVMPYGNNDLMVVGNYESESVQLGDHQLTNNSDTGSYHVHASPDWHWRHSNFFVANYNDEFNTIPTISPDFAPVVYPNPSNGLFTISAENIEELSVYNINGQLIQHKIFSKQNGLVDEISIDISNEQDGIYLLKVTSDGKPIVSKIIKQSRR